MFNEVVSPFEKYSGSEVVDQLKSNGFDAVIVIDIRQVGSERKSEHIPDSMIEAMSFSISHKHVPDYNEKYRPTIIRVYHLGSGGLLWYGEGLVNATHDSVNWHKKSGKILAKKLASALNQAGFLN